MMRQDRGLLGELDDRAGGVGGGLFLTLAVAVALFVCALFVLRADKIFGLPASLAAMTPEDLAAYHRAATLALSGEAARAYDPAAFREGLPAAGQGLLFLNPPHFLLLIAPLGLVPYGAAKAAWIATSAGALIGLALLLGRDRASPPLLAALLAVSPAAFAAALVWQLSFVIATALAAGLLLARERPLVAGALLALASVKPQFGLMIPVVLIAFGDWKAIRAAAIVGAGLFAISLLVFGVETWRAFFSSLTGAHAAHAAALMRDAVTVHQTAGKLGAAIDARAALQITAAAVYAALTWLAARRVSRRGAVGFALLATFAAAPSAWIYDWLIVSAGLLLILTALDRPPPAPVQCLAVAVWVAPLFPLGLTSTASSLAPPALLHLFALTTAGVVLRRRRDDRVNSATSLFARAGVNKL